MSGNELSFRKRALMVEDLIRFDRRLPALERLALISLITHSNDRGQAWPAIPTIAAEMGVSERTARKVIASLETRTQADGTPYVAVQRGGGARTQVGNAKDGRAIWGRQHAYTVLLPARDFGEAPRGKDLPPSSSETMQGGKPFPLTGKDLPHQAGTPFPIKGEQVADKPSQSSFSSEPTKESGTGAAVGFSISEESENEKRAREENEGDHDRELARIMKPTGHSPIRVVDRPKKEIGIDNKIADQRGADRRYPGFTSVHYAMKNYVAFLALADAVPRRPPIGDLLRMLTTKEDWEDYPDPEGYRAAYAKFYGAELPALLPTACDGLDAMAAAHAADLARELEAAEADGTFDQPVETETGEDAA